MAPKKLLRDLRFFGAVPLLLIMGQWAAAHFQESRPVPQEKTNIAEIKKLIEQLGSPEFTEREKASQALQKIGKPALDSLRKAAAESKDPELRRRAKEIIQTIFPDITDVLWEGLLKQGIREETKKDYRKAVEILSKAEKMAGEKFHPGRLAPPADTPILTEINLHLARCYRGMDNWQEAGNAYHKATYYCDPDSDKRERIEHEWSEMTDQLVSNWEKAVKTKIAKSPEVTKLVNKYPLVVLHSRRFAGDRYLKSVYSFKHETVDEEKHRNDVQLQFDNGRGEKTFEINMFVGQANRVLDLGAVEFTKDPDPNKLSSKEVQSWRKDGCKAIQGHTYLERVDDPMGNEFFVIFQVIDVDKDSNYMAFVWRRLPGGNLIKNP